MEKGARVAYSDGGTEEGVEEEEEEEEFVRRTSRATDQKKTRPEAVRT